MKLAGSDLAAYLKRIGFKGEPRADHSTLSALVAAHTASIPFENLNPFLGLPVDLAPRALLAKLVDQNRGGYCFEQNGLLGHVLETIGFRFTGLGARVLWRQSEDALTARTHKLLLVHLQDGPVLADVGFGGAVCTGLLDLVQDKPQETPHERFRLLQEDGEWRQQIEIDGEWRSTYRFDLTPQLPVDYELGNWWTSANPASHFTFSLIAARSPPGRRLALRNFNYSVHSSRGPTEHRQLRHPEDVCDVLEHDFELALPDRKRLLKRLAEIA